MTGGPWLVTVPYGQLPDASWTCLQCYFKGGGRPAAQIRAEAVSHVEAAGHDVTVHLGTAELLLPLATTAPPLKELTR